MKNNVLFILLALFVGGCAQTIYPEARPLDPVKVYVADYGLHSGVVMPLPDGRYVEYAFGDWGYAAENRCSPQDALGALCISAQSALGRRFITVKPGETEPRAQLWGPRQLVHFYASRSEVERLIEQLNERWERANRPPLHNPENATDYVKDDEHYSVANNCNHLTVRSLKQLGCEVKGLIVTSKFKVAHGYERPETHPPTSAREHTPQSVARTADGIASATQ